MLSLPPPPAGDLLLTASYLSYVGCFTRSYREDLLNNKWIPFLKTLEVGCAYTRVGVGPGGGVGAIRHTKTTRIGLIHYRTSVRIYTCLLQ